MNEAEKSNGDAARCFVRGQHSGVLSTISKRIDGFPFGSVAPFVLDHAGCPVILISTLAEHTKNIDADPRVSLIVQPYSPDMQVAGRVTVIGRALRQPEKTVLGARYLRLHPEAESYFAMHDFSFYRIEPVRIRFIGGFGKIHWVEPEQYLLPASALVDQEEGILEHMNSDHMENLKAYCRHVHGLEVSQVSMIGIDPDGFDLRAEAQVLRFEFAQPVNNAQQARLALVELANASKATQAAR
jgi:heme iron utilization protein